MIAGEDVPIAKIKETAYPWETLGRSSSLMETSRRPHGIQWLRRSGGVEMPRGDPIRGSSPISVCSLDSTGLHVLLVRVSQSLVGRRVEGASPRRSATRRSSRRRSQYPEPPSMCGRSRPTAPILRTLSYFGDGVICLGACRGLRVKGGIWE